MLASRAGIEKRNAAGNGQHANTARTVKLPVTMRMGNVTELESKLVYWAPVGDCVDEEQATRKYDMESRRV